MIAAVLCALLFCSCVTNGEIAAYNAGVEAYNAKDFARAKQCFIAANDYGNSKSYLNAIAEFERIYLEALSFFDARDYEAAKNSFKAIADFENASEYVDFISRLEQRYDEGLAAYESEDYVLAKERFVQSMGYKDANEYVSRIDRFEDSYQIALGYAEEGNYPQAIEAFRRIGVNYRDSEQKIEELLALIRSKGVTAVQLLTFYFESSSKAGDNVSITTTDINDAAFTATTSDEILITGDIDREGYITAVSFWLPDKKAKELGEDKVERIFAHMIRALGANEAEFDGVLESLTGYLEGQTESGGYWFSTREDGSGFKVLEAIHGE